MTTGTSNSLDLTNVLSDVRPQDDLFRHVNGVWLRDAEIPADRARFGAFDELRMESEDRVRKIIDECAASAATPTRPAAPAQAQQGGATRGTSRSLQPTSAGAVAARAGPNAACVILRRAFRPRRRSARPWAWACICR